MTRNRPADDTDAEPINDATFDDNIAEEAPSSGATFAELGLSSVLVEALAKAGITSPFPIQELTIPDALSGRDICGKARTGSGKTLAFGLPMLERTVTSKPQRPQALVLVPTRELANQIVDVLVPLCAVKGLWICSIFGGASMNRQVDMLRAGVDIVIATPGRLNDLLDRRLISVADVRTLVLDEADQMADMGFMPQVERILGQIEQEHQTLLFSATLDGDVDRLVKKHQHDPIFQEVPVPEDEISTMLHRFIEVDDADKVAVAAAILAGPERSLVFVRTQRGADRVVKQLEREGVKADALHGGLSQPQRERVLKAFAKGQSPVLVATNVAARGLHIDDVNIVIHFDPPEEHKTYVHRSGRTARAGASGVVVTLVLPEQMNDVNALRRMANLREAVVHMTPADPRLADLEAWQPDLDDFTIPARRGGAPSSPRGRAPQRGGWRGNDRPQHMQSRSPEGDRPRGTTPEWRPRAAAPAPGRRFDRQPSRSW